jgi:iron complex outermembrane receptor protein
MKLTGTRRFLMLLAIMQANSAIAETGQTQNFNIPAQSLSSALLQFSENTGVKTFFSADVARDIKTPGLSGSYTPQQALDKLLSNTGVAYRFTDTHSVTLEKKAPASNAAETTTLKPMTVKGTRDYDPNDPYNTDYNRRNASTATKTDTPIMETPLSIQVVPRATIQDQQAIQLGDAVKNVSGVFQGFHLGWLFRGVHD